MIAFFPKKDGAKLLRLTPCVYSAFRATMTHHQNAKVCGMVFLAHRLIVNCCCYLTNYHRCHRCHRCCLALLVVVYILQEYR